MQTLEHVWTAAVWLAEQYDRLPILFVLVMSLAMTMAASHLAVSSAARGRGTALGFTVGIAYLVYRYTLGDFEYPAESLGAVLRAYFAGAFAAAVLVILAGAWESVRRWRWAARNLLSKAGKVVCKLWTWL